MKHSRAALASLVALCQLALLSCEQTAVVGKLCVQSPCAAEAPMDPPVAGSCASPPCQPYTSDEPEPCTPLTLDARQPLDIYMMVDNSGSLLFSWEHMRQALQEFFRDPASVGVGVGIQFFGESCDARSYAEPLVPIGQLPDNAAQLSAAIPLLPVEDTPTRPALEGAIGYAREWARQKPGHKVIVLLITDGLPEECDSTVENVTRVAHEGFRGSPSVQTFVVGIDAIAGIFEAIAAFAQAGGSQPMTVASGVAADLRRALADVRDMARVCELSLPVGAAVAANRLRLQHVASDGAISTLSEVADASSCDSARQDFYVDDRSAPTRLYACPASCERWRAGGEVQLLAGCPAP